MPIVMRRLAMPELRLDPLRNEWVAYATERNDRTFLPTEFCPLCPSGTDGHSEVPLDTFEIVVFENRFPAFVPDRHGGRPVRPASTGCEVVGYTPEHERTLAQLPADRVRLLVDVWSDRPRGGPTRSTSTRGGMWSRSRSSRRPSGGIWRGHC